MQFKTDPLYVIKEIEQDIANSIYLQFLINTSKRYKDLLILARLLDPQKYKQLKWQLEENAQNSFNLIRTYLNQKISPSEIKLGDLHPNLYNKILLPKNLHTFRIVPNFLKAPEISIYTFLQILNLQPFFIKYKLAEQNKKFSTYTQPFRNSTSVNDYKTLYFNYGQLIGIAAFLGIGDLISENVLFVNNKPMVVDYEIYFDPVILAKLRFTETGLYPPYPTEINVTPLEYGGFRYNKDAINIIKISDNQIVLQEGKLIKLPAHLQQPYYNYIKELLGGIQYTLNLIRKHYAEFLDLLHNSTFTMRVVLHSTRKYYKYMQLLSLNNQPTRLRLKIFSEITHEWLRFIGLNNSWQIAKDIIDNALRKFYIPLFWYKDDILYNASGKSWRFKYSYKKWVLNYYKNLDLDFLEQQITRFIIAPESR